MTEKVWFVTGASRGLGKAIAQAALADGDRVVATARDASRLQLGSEGDGDRILTASLDITDADQAEAAVARAVERFGRIDTLVNNAGFGFLGYFEELAPDEVRSQFDTNLFGAMNVIRAALPQLRRQRSGRIFTFSSLGGVTGFEGSTGYSSSKFAIEGMSESLAKELASFGIRLTIVEPGYFRTDFLDASSVRYGSRRVDDYREKSEARRGFIRERNGRQAGDPARLAAALVRLAGEADPPLRFLAGSDAVEMAERVWRERLAELERWRHLSVTTDIADPAS